MTPRLPDLREPPIVGKFYMVPTVTYYWRGQVSAWPVLGGLHHDREHIGFEHLHYHFDGRFLTSRQLGYIRNHGGEMWHRPGYALNANILSDFQDDYWLKKYGTLPRKPVLTRRRCARPIQPWVVEKESEPWGLAKVYGDPATAIARPDGRLLCPHRKADLSQLIPDADGLVTCPLHGLRVRCASTTSSSQSDGRGL